jgi:hypothetical protein
MGDEYEAGAAKRFGKAAKVIDSGVIAIGPFAQDWSSYIYTAWNIAIIGWFIGRIFNCDTVSLYLGIPIVHAVTVAVGLTVLIWNAAKYNSLKGRLLKNVPEVTLEQYGHLQSTIVGRFNGIALGAAGVAVGTVLLIVTVVIMSGSDYFDNDTAKVGYPIAAPLSLVQLLVLITDVSTVYGNLLLVVVFFLGAFNGATKDFDYRAVTRMLEVSKAERTENGPPKNAKTLAATQHLAARAKLNSTVPLLAVASQ